MGKSKLVPALVGDEDKQKKEKKKKETAPPTPVPAKSQSAKDALADFVDDNDRPPPSSSSSSPSPSSSSSSAMGNVRAYLSGFASVLKFLYATAWSVGALHAATIIVNEAFTIRLYAIEEYGRIIHEFDPYFNYRATEYLYEHGWHSFARWYDYMVWYPLGRPVGTTIYPGMQVTAVFLKNLFDFVVNRLGGVLGTLWVVKGSMSLNDICCFIPAWFGGAATVCTGLMAYEASLGVAGVDVPSTSKAGGQPQEFISLFNTIPLLSILYRTAVVPLTSAIVKLIRIVFGSDLSLDTRTHTSLSLMSPAVEVGLCTMAIMAVVPAHIMRSVGGGYDNESVAMTAMTLTFWLWMRSLRGGGDDARGALRWGCAAGLAYFYMAAVWGGYVFVINLIGCHAALLILLGRYTTKLHRAYTSFYVIGTILATTVPVVGWTPVKSLEQMGPMAVFFGMQLIEYCEVIRKRRKLDFTGAWTLRVKVFGLAAVIAAMVAAALWPTGYFGPISARVRGLFVKHTKTGNPLVDSVAEHQAASSDAYYQYLNDAVYIAPVGFVLVGLFYFHDSSSFLLVYGMAAYFFSHKMVRLILLTGPIASALSGVVLGRAAGWCLASVVDWKPSFGYVLGSLGLSDLEEEEEGEGKEGTGVAVVDAEIVQKKGGKGKKSKKKKQGGGGGTKKSSSDDKEDEVEEKSSPSSSSSSSHLITATVAVRSLLIKLVRLVLCFYLLRDTVLPRAQTFLALSHQMAKQMSHPTILYKAKTHSGQSVMIDDYREAYLWLKDNTPPDSRIMAWWDYGYQITAISNRTTIADGNTWNHEHIALLGRTLTSPERDAHRIARHLADYVLVWAGGGGDDLAKSPHLARIANSIYRDMCPNDPTCASFGFVAQGQPSPSMGASLLYKLHSNNLVPGVEVDRNRFKEVYTSKHGKVRIYKILSVSKDSKDWVMKNRECDVPGSWYCPGKYPPPIQKIVNEGRNFAQLEDFNRGDSDEEYQKRYFEMLNDPDKAKKHAMKQNRDGMKKMKASQIEEVMKLPQFQKQVKIMNGRENWMDSEMTSRLWELVSGGDLAGLKEVLMTDPSSLYLRSKDGRGPMFWAYESGNERVIKFLKKFGVSDTTKDAQGKTPQELMKGS